MKRIAFIELDTHAEIASSFMKLAKKVADLQVDYYFSQKILSRLGIPDSENVYLADAQTVADLVSNKNYDLVVIGTAHRYFNTFHNISKRNKTALIVHNVNFSKAGRFRLLLNCYKSEQIFRLKLLLREGLLKAPHFYRNTRSLVLDEAMTDQTRHFLHLFFTENRPTQKSDILTVAVPGTVSQSRRDYAHIFEKIVKFKNPTRLVLLGKASGKELSAIEDLIKKLPQHIDLIYFKEKVSTWEFSLWMDRADVLWCPVKTVTSFFDVKEFYGKTKMTGNLGDAINFGKIAVFSKNYASYYNFIKPEMGDVESQLIALSKSYSRDLFADFRHADLVEKFRKTLNNLM